MIAVLTDAVILVVSLLWCGAMARRWREDWESIKDPKDASDRIVGLLLWGVTAVALWVAVTYLWAIFAGVAG